jgi:Ca-activated chloride channel family protein
MDLSLFHFLRPAWLLLLIPAFILSWVILKRQDPLRPWRKIMAPNLLAHLLITDKVKQQRIRPTYIMVSCWVLGIFALAGPSWEKEASPFAEDQAALFIVLKVTPQMLAQDIQPSRLQRATQKIDDLLALRPGTRTGLIAYAGSAHLVMPLTSDSAIILEFARELEPGVMPVNGDEPVAAIELAQQRLKNSGLPGSVLLISDSIDPAQQEGLAAAYREAEVKVQLYAMSAGPEVVPPVDSPPAPALDKPAMQAAADAMGGDLVLATADDADVRRLNANIERSISRAPAQDGERWKDEGYLVLPLLILLCLTFFRTGGAVALYR